MKVGIGQDSHRSDFENKDNKKLILGGVVFEGYHPLTGNSDADVILHSLTNAISGVTCVNILGEIADIFKSNNLLHQSFHTIPKMKLVHN